MVMDIKDHGTGALVKRFLDSNPQFDSSFGSKEKESVAPLIWDNPLCYRASLAMADLGFSSHWDLFPRRPLPT